MESWERLFDYAITCLDSIARTGSPLPAWTFGGGTALMRRYHHRNSRDIDIFLPDPSYVDILVPDRNEAVGALTEDYVKDHLHLKLRFAEGEIDFIAASNLTQNPSVNELIHGRSVDVETSEEVVAKELRFRAGGLKVRDVFDIAVVLDSQPERLWETSTAWYPSLDDVAHRLHLMSRYYDDEISALDILPEGEPFRPTALDRVKDNA